jgi:Holliday junction resolvasome RuvABC endonuclease subunit
MDFLSIDPGSQHCGWCLAERPGSGPVTGGVLPPDVFFEFIEEVLSDQKVVELVVEEYRVLSVAANAYSTLGTVEVIGVLRFLAARFKVPMVMQPPGIKKPTKGRLLGHGVKSVIARNFGPLRNHATDAELHAYHRLWQAGDNEPGWLPD